MIFYLKLIKLKQIKQWKSKVGLIGGSFDGQPFANGDASDASLVKFDTQGTRIWTRLFSSVEHLQLKAGIVIRSF